MVLVRTNSPDLVPLFRYVLPMFFSIHVNPPKAASQWSESYFFGKD
jgi:hypothetical protein